MRQSDILRLLSLAAIWGASFLFMRILAPVLGALWTTESRVGLASIAMLVFVGATGQKLQLRKHWKPYLVMGTLTASLPFALYSFAALTLPASYSAMISATIPLWSTLMGALMLGETLSVRKICGLASGILGVGFLVRLGPVEFSHELLIAALACVAATLCYGIAGVYSKKAALNIPSSLMATGSQIGATVGLLPFLPLSPVRDEITPLIVFSVMGIALLCSAVAYVLYFRLIDDLGPTKAQTVMFLVPLFALLWGTLFLGETINVNTVIGCALVVLATWLVMSQPKSVATA